MQYMYATKTMDYFTIFTHSILKQMKGRHEHCYSNFEQVLKSKQCLNDVQ